MGCFIATSLTYIFGTLLTANGNLFQLNIIAGSGMAFNLIMNLILIPRFHATGAAVSSLITQSASALLQILLVHRIFKFRVNKRLLFQLAFFIPSVVMLGLLSKIYFTNWIIASLGFMAVSAVIAFGIRLLHIKSILRILKYG